MNKNHTPEKSTQELDIPSFVKDMQREREFDRQNDEVIAMVNTSARRERVTARSEREIPAPNKVRRMLGKAVVGTLLVGGTLLGGGHMLGEAFDNQMDHNDKVNEQHYEQWRDSIMNDENIPLEQRLEIIENGK